MLFPPLVALRKHRFVNLNLHVVTDQDDHVALFFRQGLLNMGYKEGVLRVLEVLVESGPFVKPLQTYGDVLVLGIPKSTRISQ